MNKTSFETKGIEPLLDLAELAAVMKRSPGSIKNDLRRNPDAVPPRMKLPGTRLLRWHSTDVQRWLLRHAGEGANGTK